MCRVRVLRLVFGGLLVIVGCDLGCACSCYIQVYNNFCEGGIWTVVLRLFFECLSSVDLAWMHMQAKHKAKPSHNNTYIPQLCNSLPPCYWVFVVISRLWMALMVCSTGGTLHLIVSLTVPMTSAHTLTDTHKCGTHSLHFHTDIVQMYKWRWAPAASFFYFNSHTQRFLHLDFYRIRSSACCHVGGDPERLPWTL